MPFVGTMGRVMLGYASVSEEMARIYNKYPNDRYIGMYDIGNKPSFMLRDPELIKRISIKDFDSFVNHNFQPSSDADPLMSRVVFTAKDQRWRDLRSVLSPLFTGSKMRMMHSLVVDSFETSAAYLRQEITDKSGSGGALEYDLMEVFSACGNDIIASCAFGIQLDSLKNKDNEFFEAGRVMAYAIQSIKALIISSLPKLASFFRIKIIDQKYDQLFREVVRQNVQQRKEKKILRNDMIQLMFLAQQGKLDLKEKEELSDAGFATISEEISSRAAEKLRELTEDDYVAQCLLFLLAGFTAIATTMSYACYELAINPDIQERLRNEIDEMHAALNGKKVTYEALQKMTYLDQVISEVLRKWPAATLIDRRTNKQYTVENWDGSKLISQPGDSTWFPIYAIHHDPKYYPEPEKFDPDRFSPENRNSINSAAFIPFGLGPRACIGNRFALMAAKSVMYLLIRDFYLECSQKTDIPLKLKKGTFALDVENGLWIQVRVRNGE